MASPQAASTCALCPQREAQRGEVEQRHAQRFNRACLSSQPRRVFNVRKRQVHLSHPNQMQQRQIVFDLRFSGEVAQRPR